MVISECSEYYFNMVNKCSLENNNKKDAKQRTDQSHRCYSTFILQNFPTDATLRTIRKANWFAMSDYDLRLSGLHRYDKTCDIWSFFKTFLQNSTLSNLSAPWRTIVRGDIRYLLHFDQ